MSAGVEIGQPLNEAAATARGDQRQRRRSRSGMAQQSGAHLFGLRRSAGADGFVDRLQRRVPVRQARGDFDDELAVGVEFRRRSRGGHALGRPVMRGGVGLQEDAREERVHRVGTTQQVIPGDAGNGRLHHGVWSGPADQRQQRLQVGGGGAFHHGGLKARDLLIEVQQLGQNGRHLREFLRTFDPPLPGHLQVYLPVTR